MSAKRGPKQTREAATYAISDVVLGKVRGYPPWPGMVIDPETVPKLVAEIRPLNKKTTFYCVRFFPNSDHAWLVEKDISRLQPHEIEAFISDSVAKKRGDLMEAYHIAREPKKWLEKKAMEEAAHEDDEDGDGDAAAEEVDQLENETAGGASASAKTKKRKRESEAGASAKTRKPPQKNKKDPNVAGESSVRKKNPGAKGKRNGAKSKAMIESEDDGDHDRSASGAEDAGPSYKASPPPPKKFKRDKEEAEEPKEDPEAVKVRDWRHKLQKTFLGKGLPQDEDMPDLDKLFRRVEECDVTIEQLQFSKIGKVMRHIAALKDELVPRDREYRFRERAKALVERWQAILTASKNTNANGSDTANATAAAITVANGNTSFSPPVRKSAKHSFRENPDADAQGEKEDGGDGSVAEATAAINLNGEKVHAGLDVGMADA